MTVYKASEIKVSYKAKKHNLPIVANPDTVADIVRSAWDKNRIEMREEFKVLLLNRANIVLGFFNVSAGGVSSTSVDPKIVFSVALKSLASAIVIAHNHPSGNTTPSTADIALTKKIKQGCELLDIQLLDHINLTADSFYSFANEGII